jgi:hypothetical protein
MSIKMAQSYSKIETEIIVLRAVTDLIDSMVNCSIFEVVGESPDANIIFHTSTHQKLFNILLVDLLSKPDDRLVGYHVPYLIALHGICEKPEFDVNGSIAGLKSAVASLTDWLTFEPTVDAWLPSISSEVRLTLPRSSFIRICGNISKHSLLRQSQPAKELKALLERAGVFVTLDDAVLALVDFYERFHMDIFNYHSSTIVELLNDIQWGTYQYLIPEYQRSYVYDGGPMMKYHFSPSQKIQSGLAKLLYEDLMNWIRRKPLVNQFTVTRYLKMRY